MAYRKNDNGETIVSRSILRKEIEHYFRLADVVEKTRQRLHADEFYHVGIEHFLANPAHELQKLCEFIGLLPNENYIEACTSILYNNPHRSRYKIYWPQDLIERVSERIPKYPLLQCYNVD